MRQCKRGWGRASLLSLGALWYPHNQTPSLKIPRGFSRYSKSWGCYLALHFPAFSADVCFTFLKGNTFASILCALLFLPAYVDLLHISRPAAKNTRWCFPFFTMAMYGLLRFPLLSPAAFPIYLLLCLLPNHFFRHNYFTFSSLIWCCVLKVK